MFDQRPAPWLLLLFVAWAVLTSAWSPYSDHGQALRFSLTLGLGLLFVADQRGKEMTEAGGAAALIVLALMLAIEAFAGMAFNRAAQPDAADWVLARNPGRGASVLVVLVWPVLGALMARGGPARATLFWLLLIVSAVIAAQFGMDANLIAYAAGASAFAVALAAPRAMILASSFGLAAWLLAAPFVTPLLLRLAEGLGALPHSWAVRAEIWRFAVARIHEARWIGHGMDASRTFTETISVGGETMRALPLHPHSASLQVWLETGAVGALLGAAALAAAGLAMARSLSSRASAAAACATLVAAGVLSNVSYGAWQEWWVASLLTAAALVTAVPRGSAAASSGESALPCAS